MIDYKKLTEPYKEIMLDELKKFVRIDSQYDEKTIDKQNPFGKGVSKALAYVDELAKKDGFKSTNYDNYVVEILCGTGKKNITIMAHADVVPEGTGWDQDPFEVTEKDGVLCARGVADDKGPMLSCYYALKALRDNNLLGDYTVRFLVGGNEENGSACMHYYFHTLNKPQPDLGFSPDSNFPLTFAEKGMLNYEVKKEVEFDQLISIKSGVAFNSVIEKAIVVMKNDQAFINYLKDKKVDFNYEINNEEEMTLTFIGKAAHGSLPWLGVNAGLNAVKYLGEFYDNADFKQLYVCLAPSRGEGLNCAYHTDEFGDNSLCVGLLNYNDGLLSATVNFRHINTCEKPVLLERTINALSPFKVENVEEVPLLYYPLDSVLVSTLLKAYQDETGDLVTPPLASGGGTYAKEADNVVAFGMEFPGFESNMHSPGESSKVDDLVISMAIFARAIVELGKKL